MNRCACGRACRNKVCGPCKSRPGWNKINWAKLQAARRARVVEEFLREATDAQLLNELERRGLHPDGNYGP